MGRNSANLCKYVCVMVRVHVEEQGDLFFVFLFWLCCRVDVMLRVLRASGTIHIIYKYIHKIYIAFLASRRGRQVCVCLLMYLFGLSTFVCLYVLRSLLFAS